MPSFERLSDLTDCILCPRECHADRIAGNTGVCGCDAQIRIAGHSLHFWEEPCISGTGGSGTVFFTGCSLGCIFCQNASVSQQQNALLGKAVSADELADIFFSLEAQGAHNINLVTPSHYAPLLIPAMEKARLRGLTVPYVWNTGSYERPEMLAALDGLADIYLADLKFMDPELSRKYSSAPDYFETASAAISEMVRQHPEPLIGGDGLMTKGVIVRHLVMPRQSVDSEAVIKWLHRTFGEKIYLSLMNQYTPMPEVIKTAGSSDDPAIKALAHKVSKRTYEKMIDLALSEGVENGFIQEGPTAEESFIPSLIRDFR
ncbi:MAG: radical SAM protein [Lachnospiraceae bacterium]|nr:radical SAM protein [Lachnospiraceae bacterium]